PLYLDVTLPANASFDLPLPAGHNAFIYPYRGHLVVDETCVPEARMAILANDAAADGVRIVAPKESRCIVVAGRPLHEPIAQYGPFVMNTQAEIIQAMEDYRAGRFAA